MNYVSPEGIVGRRMYFYYSGWKSTHGAPDNVAGIGLATLLLDRIVAVEPKRAQGTLTTRVLKIEGERLEINVDADKGRLLVEVLDETGQVLPGFEVDACRAISSDARRRRMKWDERKLKQLSGQRVRLRFHLSGECQLFAFRIR